MHLGIAHGIVSGTLYGNMNGARKQWIRCLRWQLLRSDPRLFPVLSGIPGGQTIGMDILKAPWIISGIVPLQA